MFLSRVVHKEDIHRFWVLRDPWEAGGQRRFIFLEPEGSCVAIIVEEASFGDLQEITSRSNTI